MDEFLEEISEIKKQNEELKKKFKDSKENKHYEKQLIQKIEILASENMDLRSTKEDYEDLKVDFNEKMANLGELLKKEEEAKLITTENMHLHKEITELKHNLKDFGNEKLKLKRKMEDYNKLNEDNGLLENENEILKMKVFDFNLRLEEYEKIYEEQNNLKEKEAQEKIEDSEKERQKDKTRFEAKISYLEKKIQGFSESMEHLKVLEKQNFDLKLDYDSEVEKLKLQIYEFKNKVEHFEKLFNDKNYAFQDLEELYEINLKQIEELTNTTQQLTSELGRIEQEKILIYEEWSQKNDLLEISLKDKLDVIKNYEEENEKLRTDLAILEKERSEAENNTVSEIQFPFPEKNIESKEHIIKESDEHVPNFPIKASSIEDNMYY